MPGAVLLAVVGGVLAAELAARRNPIGIIMFPALLLPVALWRWPRLGPFLVLGGAVVVEQFPYRVGPYHGVVTEDIPLFRSFVRGTGVSPLEVLLLIIVLIWTMQGALAGTLRSPRSALARVIVLWLVVVTVFLGIGLARHGNAKIALWEVRSWFYLGITYLLGSSLLETEAAARTLLWTMVLGSGFKGVLGSVEFLRILHMNPRPEATLGHEESFFFGLFILLTLGLWLLGIRGRLRTVATALLPVVLLGDMGNSRRVAWAIIGVGMVVLLVVAHARLRGRRRTAVRIAAVSLAVLSTAYIAAFWNHTGAIGSPARAVHAAIHPDPRDLQSNQYRLLEDENLVINIRAHNALGSGFGLPIDYAIPIVNLTSIDSAISYIPHNGVLWTWMRTGVVGEVLLWLLILEALIRSCRLAMHPDRESSLLGAVAVCAVVSYVIIGYYDMGFFWFRIALYMGLILGCVEAQLRRLGSGSVPAVAEEVAG